MGSLLLVWMLLAVCGSSSIVSLQLEDKDRAVVSVEAEDGHVTTVYSSQYGLVSVPVPKDLVQVFVDSKRFIYPKVEVIVSKKQVFVRRNGTEVQPASNGVYNIAAARKTYFYEEKQPFSLVGFLKSPMIVMGSVTIGMMALMQVLIGSLGNVDDIRRELRGEFGDDKDEKAVESKKTK